MSKGQTRPQIKLPWRQVDLANFALSAVQEGGNGTAFAELYYNKDGKEYRLAHTSPTLTYSSPRLFSKAGRSWWSSIAQLDGSNAEHRAYIEFLSKFQARLLQLIDVPGVRDKLHSKPVKKASDWPAAIEGATENRFFKAEYTPEGAIDFNKPIAIFLAPLEGQRKKVSPGQDPYFYATVTQIKRRRVNNGGQPKFESTQKPVDYLTWRNTADFNYQGAVTIAVDRLTKFVGGITTKPTTIEFSYFSASKYERQNAAASALVAELENMPMNDDDEEDGLEELEASMAALALKGGAAPAPAKVKFDAPAASTAEAGNGSIESMIADAQTNPVD